MGTQIIQARISESALEQVTADAMALGLDNTSEAIREGLALLHRKAEQVRLGQAYDDFYGGVPAPMGDVMQALWGE